MSNVRASRSASIAEWLAFSKLDQGVTGSNPGVGENLSESKLCFIACLT